MWALRLVLAIGSKLITRNLLKEITRSRWQNLLEILVTAIAQQPDASATITRTLFVGLAMIEFMAIYCFVVSMILIFANPFWNHVIAQAAGK